MTDSEMEVILNMVDDIFTDQIEEGHHPISVASVVYAVAIKHLKINLDKQDFVAIIDEIRNTDPDELIEIRYVESSDTKKRTIH